MREPAGRPVDGGEGHVPDGEAGRVEPPEDPRQRVRGAAVDDEFAGGRLTIEAAVGDDQEPEARHADGTAVVPKAAPPDQPPSRRRERDDRELRPALPYPRLGRTSG